MKQPETKSCDEIMTIVYKPIEFVVEGLLAQGLYIPRCRRASRKN